MLRSISSKMGGLVLVMVFLAVFWIRTSNYACCYFISLQVLFWFMATNMLLLSYLGVCHPEPPYVMISQVSSLLSVVGLFCYKGLWSYNK